MKQASALLALLVATSLAAGCGSDHPRPRVGDLTVSYTLQSGACTTPTVQSASPNTYIWFELVDANGNTFSIVDWNNYPTAVPCDAANHAFVVPSVPFGNYWLNGIQEVEIEADNRTFIVYQYNCVPTGFFQHTQANDVFPAPAMVAQASGGTITCF